MSKTCSKCGNEVNFRWIGGRVVPLGCCCISDFSSNVIPSRILREDSTFLTTCPRCGLRTYFIRHNGGSVWIDELGMPWPKHSCFSEEKNDEMNAFVAVKEASSLGTIEKAGFSDWKGRPMIWLRTIRFTGWAAVEGCAIKLMPGELVLLNDTLTCLYTIRQESISLYTEVRTCGHCDQFFLLGEFDTHSRWCFAQEKLSCQQCGEEIHWTEYDTHKKNHRKD